MLLSNPSLKRSLILSGYGLDLQSNDVLGLANNAEVRSDLVKFLESSLSKLGGTGSPLVSGLDAATLEASAYFCEVFRAPAATFFTSGFAANVGVVQALSSLKPTFFSDALNHASLVDGMRLSRCAVEIYPHLQTADLKARLLRSPSQNRVVVTESVFSMDGDVIEINPLLEASQDAWLLVDEAHALGYCGRRGLGCLEGVSVNWDRTVVVHTLSKALGGQGAVVLSSRAFQELMIHHSRSFIYSTSLSPLLVAQARLALGQLLAHPHWVTELRQAAGRLKSLLQMHFPRVLGEGHILATWVGDEMRALKQAQELERRGLLIKAMRYPTVPRGEARLRWVAKRGLSEAQWREIEIQLEGWRRSQ